jgi:addiction module RelE/StbE family toxin
LSLRWTRPALADLIEAQEYIAHENPPAAQAVAQHVWDAARNLQDNPEIGRVGHVAGTREWAVTQTPYLIVYRVADDDVGLRCARDA